MKEVSFFGSIWKGFHQGIYGGSNCAALPSLQAHTTT
jgi:hypothetical protein